MINKRFGKKIRKKEWRKYRGVPHVRIGDYHGKEWKKCKEDVMIVVCCDTPYYRVDYKEWLKKNKKRLWKNKRRAERKSEKNLCHE